MCSLDRQATRLLCTNQENNLLPHQREDLQSPRCLTRGGLLLVPITTGMGTLIHLGCPANPRFIKDYRPSVRQTVGLINIASAQDAKLIPLCLSCSVLSTNMARSQLQPNTHSRTLTWCCKRGKADTRFDKVNEHALNDGAKTRAVCSVFSV